MDTVHFAERGATPYTSAPLQTVILALDPGQRTGVALARLVNEQLVSFQCGEGDFSTLQLFGLLESICPSYLVAEQFDYRNKSRPGLVLYSRNLLGVSEMWAELRDSCYRTQSAARGKSFFTDAKLRQLGLYEPGKPHARDALRHLLAFLEFGLGSMLWNGSLVTTMTKGRG